MRLLEKLCSIHAPSGNESDMTRFLLGYVKKHGGSWKVTPRVFSGDGFQDCLALVFGKPRTAMIAHMDSIGFTARYQNELVKIGGPEVIPGTRLTGRDQAGPVACTLQEDEKGTLFAQADRLIAPGTDLTYKPNFRQSRDFVQSPYLDNRLGVWVALRTCESLENGIVLFSCHEEHGGGSAGYLAQFAWQYHGVRQFLICDITWVTQGVRPGKGVVVSLRDRGIPRKSYVSKVAGVLAANKVRFQQEVEGSGGSDGTEIQRSAVPADWCFVGAAEDHVHSPDEKVHKTDMRSMARAYRVLMKHL